MKKRIFIIHSWGGSPEGGCFPWLKSELRKNGFEVNMPQMPSTEEPKVEEWVDYLAGIVGNADENTYFVGHSIGCQTIMRYLQTVDRKIGGALFIAGWFNLDNLEPDEIEIAKPWIVNSIDLNKLKSISDNYSLIISDDDPFGCFEENIEKFKKINAKINVLHNSGHIENRQLPVALDEILKITK